MGNSFDISFGIEKFSFVEFWLLLNRATPYLQFATNNSLISNI